MSVSQAQVQKPSLEEIQSLYDQDRYLDAFALASRRGDLASWRGPAERVLAGRLAYRLGGARLGQALQTLAYREHPQDCVAICYHGYVVLGRLGPAGTLEYWHRHGELAGAPPAIRAYWLSVRATASWQVRDFDAAERDLDAALQLEEAPWSWACRSELRQTEDRYEEAIEAAERALELRPSYCTAAQQMAELLTLRNRLGEAIELLGDLARPRQSPLLQAHLAHLHELNDDYRASLDALDRFEQLTPFKTPQVGQWLLMRRAYLHHLMGDVGRCISFSRQIRSFGALADHMEKNLAIGKRVLLPVPFVRQHHKTCAPATLTAISQFWSRSAEHLSVAEEICYDGTPAYYERTWATDHGWVVREFTVTWASARCLIDRGIPFTLTTSEPTYSHLQAVVGYDSYRGTLLVRDPYVRTISEFDVEKTLRRYQSTGPRGMAMVPSDKAAMLEGLALPDERIWDDVHSVREALEQHRREAAIELMDRMRQAYGDHYLVLGVRRSLAWYDSNARELLSIAEECLARYPGDALAEAQKIDAFRRLGRQKDLMRLLAEICARPGVDPVFHQFLAQEMLPDHQQAPHAARQMRWVLRRHRGSAYAYRTYADICWDQRDREKAILFYRSAACLEIADERLGRTLFAASRCMRRTEESLGFLRRRFERFGGKSGFPARTLFECLEDLDRAQEGLGVLDEALQKRKDDGELMLFVAEVQMRYGRQDVARDLLTRAKSRCPRLAWLRSAAVIARLDGRRADALEYAGLALAIDPLAIDMHREVATRLAEQDGVGAAVSHLRSAVGQFPHHYPLRSLLLEWVYPSNAADWERDIRELVELFPMDAWARRQLAENLRKQRRLDDAMAEIERARLLDPHSSSYHNVLGDIQLARGDMQGATDSFKQALCAQPDDTFAIDRLMEILPDRESRAAALRHLQQQLEQQVIFGAGLLAYAQHARELIPDAEVLAHLQQAIAVRPDLSQSWVALTRQHVRMKQFELATQTATRATERFPLIPFIWLELGATCAAAGDAQGQLKAVKTAYELDPRAGNCARELARLLNEQGKRGEAIELLKAAIIRLPLDAANHAALGYLLREASENAKAIEHLKRAVTLDPAYRWAWETLHETACRNDQPQFCVELAHNLTRELPGEPNSWMILATIPDENRIDERIEAARKAAQLAPHMVDAHDLLAWLLARASRFDDAIAACRPEVFASARPRGLLAREYWLLYYRGEQAASIKAMAELVSREPDFAWGCEMLVSWLETSPQDARYQQAAQRLAELRPRDAVAWAHLAAARLARDARPAAIEALRQSMDLDPKYEYPVSTLLQVSLEGDDKSTAQEMLERLRRHQPGPRVELFSMRAKYHGHKPAEAAEHLRALCAHPAVNRELLNEAKEIAARHHQLPAFLRALTRALRGPDANPELAYRLILEKCAQDRWIGAYVRLLLLRKRPELRRFGWVAFCSQLSQYRKRAWTIWCLLAHRKLLAADNDTWVNAGAALMSAGMGRLACRWHRGYVERKGLGAPALFNVAMSFANRTLDAQAYAATARVSDLPASAEKSGVLALAALYDGLSGKVEQAKERLQLATAHVEQMKPDMAMIFAIAQGLVELQQTPPEQRGPAFERIRTRLVRQAGQTSPAYWQPAVLRLYLAAGTRLSKLGGSSFQWRRPAMARGA